MKSLLNKLQIKPVNPGLCAGQSGWIEDTGGQLIDSYNPTTEEVIASPSPVSRAGLAGRNRADVAR